MRIHQLSHGVILNNRLCEKALGVLRQGSARTVNERYFRYLAVRPACPERRRREALEGRTVCFHTD
jgi:hypothetical protein